MYTWESKILSLGKESFSSSKKIHVYLGKQDLKFGEGKFLKLKEDPVYLGKQDLKFGEGKFLKLKEDPCNILGEVRS
jgi:hypothetical protein